MTTSASNSSSSSETSQVRVGKKQAIQTEETDSVNSTDSDSDILESLFSVSEQSLESFNDEDVAVICTEQFPNQNHQKTPKAFMRRKFPANEMKKRSTSDAKDVATYLLNKKRTKSLVLALESEVYFDDIDPSFAQASDQMIVLIPERPLQGDVIARQIKKPKTEFITESVQASKEMADLAKRNMLKCFS